MTVPFMRWLQKPADQSLIDSLVASLRVDPAFRGAANAAHILAPLLVRRGITDAESASTFLFPSLSNLHDPNRMMGLRVAVDRIDAAIERKEPILIYGDYDV